MKKIQHIFMLPVYVGLLTIMLSGGLGASCSQTETDTTTMSGGSYSFSFSLSGGGGSSPISYSVSQSVGDYFWHCDNCAGGSTQDMEDVTGYTFSPSPTSYGSGCLYYGEWDINAPFQTLTSCDNNFPCWCGAGHPAYKASYSGSIGFGNVITYVYSGS